MHDTLVQDVSDGDIKPYVADPILAESGQYINR